MRKSNSYGKTGPVPKVCVDLYSYSYAIIHTLMSTITIVLQSCSDTHFPSNDGQRTGLVLA